MKAFGPECRGWLRRSAGGVDGLRVATYNVLARPLGAERNFPGTPKMHLDWTYRGPRVLRELECLAQHGAVDVLCMQELSDYWTVFREHAATRLGMDSVYVRRPTTITTPWSGFRKEDGCGIFYRRDRFRLVDELSVFFHDLHDRVGLIVALEERAEPHRVLLAATTHLFWDDSCADEQLCELLEFEAGVAEMRGRCSSRAPALPLLFCGDLNSVPDSAVYRYVTNAFVDCNEHAPGLASAYAHYGPLAGLPASEPNYTSFSVRRKKTLDYIFYSPAHFDVAGLLEIPPPAEAMPNALYGSDHIPLLAELHWKP